MPTGKVYVEISLVSDCYRPTHLGNKGIIGYVLESFQFIVIGT